MQLAAMTVTCCAAQEETWLPIAILTTILRSDGAFRGRDPRDLARNLHARKVRWLRVTATYGFHRISIMMRRIWRDSNKS